MVFLTLVKAARFLNRSNPLLPSKICIKDLTWYIVKSEKLEYSKVQPQFWLEKVLKNKSKTDKYERKTIIYVFTLSLS